ncbi:MAG TPA: anhydro-N-acetylmuramic acid kinase [Magnetospirillaceae bacterium]|nr:anhydro-N-acetylmuramic acid kinase [Magnetospirillaceae bacterium]
MIGDGAQRTVLSLGLMSGTSLDGVDAALLSTDGETAGSAGAALTVPYPDELRRAIRAVLGGQGPVAEVERELTLFHAEVAQTLLARAGSPEVAVVGFHGHTILHQPDKRRTWQIGDGALLAEKLGIPVVNDFRSADVAAGGHGAPLMPAFHAALATGAERPLAVLNIGGVANVTWIGRDGAMLAFDTGPGNALVDDWILHHTGELYDKDGAMAAQGTVDTAAVDRFLAHPYFAKKPPKSLDRDDFRLWADSLMAGKGIADGAATLAAFTIAAVAAARQWLPEAPGTWLVCGGGRYNATLMNGMRRSLHTTVEAVESRGWDGDALEAQGFAYLAVRSLLNLPLSWPGTTGAPEPMKGGKVHHPSLK